MNKNREIKFRGLFDEERNNSYFVYGYLSKDLPGSTMYYETHSWRIHWHPEGGGTANAPVRNGTVGQFTGLKDSQGREIYEGDIVKAKHEVLDFRFGEKKKLKTEHGIIHWDHSYWALGEYKLFIMEDKSLVIIGNIYQNPDLIS